MKDPLGWSAG